MILRSFLFDLLHTKEVGFWRIGLCAVVLSFLSLLPIALIFLCTSMVMRLTFFRCFNIPLVGWALSIHLIFFSHCKTPPAKVHLAHPFLTGSVNNISVINFFFDVQIALFSYKASSDLLVFPHFFFCPFFFYDLRLKPVNTFSIYLICIRISARFYRPKMQATQGTRFFPLF